MKMQFSIIVNASGSNEIIEAKTEAEAFDIAKGRHGVTGFVQFKRYYEKDRKHLFLKRAISNVTKHKHKENRRGFI